MVEAETKDSFSRLIKRLQTMLKDVYPNTWDFENISKNVKVEIGMNFFSTLL